MYPVFNTENWSVRQQTEALRYEMLRDTINSLGVAVPKT
jgi:hypothetical protein